MTRAFFAGAFALAFSCMLPVISTPVQATELADSGSGPVTQINIGRIKSELKLTPEQQVYWPAIEAALRGIARSQTPPENAGLLRRLSSRVVSVALDGAAAARLAAAARPLIKTLSDEQKQTAMSLAQEMGLSRMLAAL